MTVEIISQSISTKVWTGLLYLVLYVPVNNFSVMSPVFLGLTSTKQWIKCRSCSRTQHSDSAGGESLTKALPTEPLRSALILSMVDVHI